MNGPRGGVDKHRRIAVALIPKGVVMDEADGGRPARARCRRRETNTAVGPTLAGTTSPVASAAIVLGSRLSLLAGVHEAAACGETGRGRPGVSPRSNGISADRLPPRLEPFFDQAGRRSTREGAANSGQGVPSERLGRDERMRNLVLDMSDGRITGCSPRGLYALACVLILGLSERQANSSATPSLMLGDRKTPRCEASVPFPPPAADDRRSGVIDHGAARFLLAEPEIDNTPGLILFGKRRSHVRDSVA